jgi:predicted small lipoprotein YifL
VKRLILAVGFVLVLAGSLAACGKKGPPEAPGQNQYPREYPAQT